MHQSDSVGCGIVRGAAARAVTSLLPPFETTGWGRFSASVTELRCSFESCPLVVAWADLTGAKLSQDTKLAFANAGFRAPPVATRTVSAVLCAGGV